MRYDYFVLYTGRGVFLAVFFGVAFSRLCELTLIYLFFVEVFFVFSFGIIFFSVLKLFESLSCFGSLLFSCFLLGVKLRLNLFGELLGVVRNVKEDGLDKLRYGAACPVSLFEI